MKIQFWQKINFNNLACVNKNYASENLRRINCKLIPKTVLFTIVVGNGVRFFIQCSKVATVPKVGPFMVITMHDVTRDSDTRRAKYGSCMKYLNT